MSSSETIALADPSLLATPKADLAWHSKSARQVGWQ